MRQDNRPNDKIRNIKITQPYLEHVKNSVLIEAGRTKAICVASMTDMVPQFLRKADHGWLKVEYSMLPYSTFTRVVRESIRGKLSGRTHEIQRLIGRSLRAVIDLSTIPGKTILIDCDIIEADGSTRCTAINGSFIALCSLSSQLGDKLKLQIKKHLAAVSVGIVDGEYLVDLTYEEDSRAELDANFVITEAEEIVELQLTGEKRFIRLEEFYELFELAKNATKEIITMQKNIRNHVNIKRNFADFT